MISNNDVFYIEWFEELEEFRLEIIPSNTVDLGVITWRQLPNEFLINLKYSWNLGDYPIGVISPTLNMELNLNLDDVNVVDFTTELLEPSDTKAIFSGFEIELRTIYKLYHNEELIYVGVVDNGVEEGYDTEKFTLSVSTTHFSRYVMQSITTDTFNLIKSDSIHTSTAKDCQAYIDYLKINVRNYVTGHTTFGNDAKDKYFWFFKFSDFESFVYNIINMVGSALLRKTWEATNSLYNEDYDVINTIINFTDSVNDQRVVVYKQLYDGSGGLGTVLDNDSIYLLGYIADDTWANKVSAITSKGLFLDVLQSKYKTFWDLWVDINNQYGYICIPSGFWYIRKHIDFSDLPLGLKFIDTPSLETRFKILSRTSASLTESYSDDLDNVEKVNPSSRTDASLPIPITFNSYFQAEKYINKIDLYWWNLFNMNNSLNFQINRQSNENVNWWGLYYFDTPTNFSDEIAFKVHNFINVQFGTTVFSALDFGVNMAGLAEAIESQLNDNNYPNVISQAYLDLFSDTKQNKISGTTNIENYGDLNSYKIRSVDLTLLAPPRQSAIFNAFYHNFKTTKLEYDIFKNEVTYEGLANDS